MPRTTDRPVRILLVSDLHYTLPQLDWVVRSAPSFDLVVLAGDQLDISSTVSLDAQSVVMLRYLALLQAAGRVVVSSGNHDLTGPDANGEQSALWLGKARAAGVPTDGDSLRVGDTLITICPWWDGPQGRLALEAQLAADARRRPARWLWVYHWPPLGTKTCWTGRRDYGDPDLVGWIAQHRPEVVLTGHVHESAFKPTGCWADRVGDTWIFNAGRQIGPVPTHIELDLDAGSASWRSMLGVEDMRLSDTHAPARTVF
ncbi:MAG TPA: metallophosphoesterase [Burkholderiaceae bacterium]|nr:metallophosphoesterase [Burkholderiaceae bacterium]